MLPPLKYKTRYDILFDKPYSMTDRYVSVIVPTYRDWKRLALCIKALSSQTYPHERFDVTVVNNDPNDRQPENFFLPANIKIITEAKPGSYAARNAALKLVQGEIIGFTDSDCIPDKDWIRNAVRYFDTHASCSRIAGKVSVFPKGLKATVAEKYDKLYAFRQKRYVSAFGTCVTANLFAYKYVFDKVGPFNDSQMSFGDLDWGMEAHKAGYKIDYAEDVVVNHPARDLNELVKKERRLAGGREKLSKESYNNKLAVYYKFLKALKPRFKGEYRFIKNNGTDMPLMDKYSVLLLRIYLMYVRANETRKLRLGKKPNRE